MIRSSRCSSFRSGGVCAWRHSAGLASQLLQSAQTTICLSHIFSARAHFTRSLLWLKYTVLSLFKKKKVCVRSLAS